MAYISAWFIHILCCTLQIWITYLTMQAYMALMVASDCLIKCIFVSTCDEDLRVETSIISKFMLLMLNKTLFS